VGELGPEKREEDRREGKKERALHQQSPEIPVNEVAIERYTTALKSGSSIR
jgi:hypothetical protein